LLKPDLASVLVVEPTVMASGTNAGLKLHAFALLLPAATTTITPPSVAFWIALAIACDVPEPPRLADHRTGFELVLCLVSTKLSESIIYWNDPLPESLRTFTACRVAFLATPYFFPPTVPAQ